MLIMSEVGTSSVAVDARGTTRQLPLCFLLPHSLSLCLSQSFFKVHSPSSSYPPPSFTLFLLGLAR